MAKFKLFKKKSKSDIPRGFHQIEIGQITKLTSDSVKVQLDIPDDLVDDFKFKPGQYQDFDIEVEHALALADMRILGTSAVWQRYSELNLQSYDKDLFLLDIFFEKSIRNENNNKSESRIFTQWQPVDTAAILFKKILTEKSVKASEVLRSSAAQLQKIKLLKLMSLKENTESTQMYLLIEPILSCSKKLWSNYFQRFNIKNEIIIELDLKEKKMQVNSVEICLRRREVALQICTVLIEKNSTVGLELLCQSLWPSAEYDQSYYHRIRMQVQRLNRSIHEKSLIEEIFVINNDKLTLNAGVRFVYA